ncbi:hypothetical protein BURMUCF2_3608 [Burkholderia multivorans CF2]|nr:hypothetical protein BURMUCF2_3608 [Burkholderia multivorans CF2]
MLGIAGAGWLGFDAHAHRGLALALLAGGAALLDAGVIVDQTLGRRAINLLNPAARGRLNGLFVGLFFVGGDRRGTRGQRMGVGRLERRVHGRARLRRRVGPGRAVRRARDRQRGAARHADLKDERPAL